MAESTLSIERTALMLEIGAFLGYGVVSGSWTSEQSAEITRYLDAGLRQYYYPPAAEGIEPGYEWSFLKPTTTLDTVADQGENDLPDLCGRILTDFFYEEDVYTRSIVLVSEARLQSYLMQSTDSANPRYAAVRHKDSTGSTGQRQEVLWWPIPDDAYTLTYQYEFYAGALTSGLSYPHGGMKHSELIKESCLAVAELLANDEKGAHSEMFFSLLKTSIAQDRKNGARYFGHMGGQDSDVVSRHQLQGSNYEITYKGDTW